MFRVIMEAPLFLGSLRRLPFCAVQITISTRKKGAFSPQSCKKSLHLFQPIGSSLEVKSHYGEHCCTYIKEYLMSYRGPGFLTVIWFDSFISPASPVSELSLFLSLPVSRQSNLLTGEGGWGFPYSIICFSQPRAPSLDKRIIKQNIKR
jgi:hypothetical protein